MRKTTYHEFQGVSFDLEGREGIVIFPETPQPGNPYIWRTEFLGAFDNADVALLRAGWHLVYYKISDQYGAPAAIRAMRIFQRQIEMDFSLSDRAVLFGFSRGGLYAVNYAAAYPDKVEKLYLDAPVLDVFSWPGGFGRGSGASKEWEECKACYKIKEEKAAAFHENPLDQVGVLLEHEIPVLLIAGDADQVVPFDENGKKLYADYVFANGPIQLILKPGCGHHPHGLDDPFPVVAFVDHAYHGCRIRKGVQPWQILQQEGGGAAAYLEGTWANHLAYQKPNVFLRAVRETDGRPVTDWTLCEKNGRRWQGRLWLPVGGLYRLESCVGEGEYPNEWAAQGDVVRHVGVGDVFVIAGQSNAVGFGKDFIVDAPQLGVHLFGNDGSWQVAAHPLGSSSHTVHPVNQDHSNPGVSPYLRFAKMLYADLGYPIGLIQTAKGGSGMVSWNPLEQGELYRNMLACMRACGQVKGVLWYQGCNEAADPGERTYLERFTQMVFALRKDSGQPGLPIFTFQLNRCLEPGTERENRSWGMVKEDQRQAALQLENVMVLPTSDAALSDLIHNSASANVMLGERLANMVLEAWYGKTGKMGKAPDVKRVFQTGERSLCVEFDHVVGRIDAGNAAADTLAFYLETGAEDSFPPEKNGITAYEFPTKSSMELTFSFSIAPGSLLSCGAEKNPLGKIPFDFASHTPVLSFYRIPVAGK